MEVGTKVVAWRYDLILITEKYSAEYHPQAFEKMASALQDRVGSCVISFLDLYEKTKRNFSAARAVTEQEQKYLATRLAKIDAKYGIPIRTCCEDTSLAQCGVDVSGCMTKVVLEAVADYQLTVSKKKKFPRAQYNCLLGTDIGMYNSCLHDCIYCYVNYDRRTIEQSVKLHGPASPFLIGGFHKEDKIIEVR